MSSLRHITTLSLVLLAAAAVSVEAAPRKKKRKEVVDTTATVAPVIETDNVIGMTTPILGEPQVSAERMWEFVRTVNADFPIELARAYYDIGRRYGVRGDIALCQAIVETGWFRFTGGTAVTPDQHNYCGLGVTSLGVKGLSFESMEQGVTAQIQHLYAYACRRSLPPGEVLVDPRFKLVRRGIAPAWEDLNLRWAANKQYGESILSLYQRMAGGQNVVTTVEEIGIEIPEEFLP